VSTPSKARRSKRSKPAVTPVPTDCTACLVPRLVPAAAASILLKCLLGLLLVMGMVGCGGGDAATTQPDAATPLPDPIENSIGMVLVPIPTGEFLMGSPETEPGRKDIEVQHQVTLTKPFFLGVHEVTQGQWQAVMGTTPWKGEFSVKEGDDYPATLRDKEAAICCDDSANASRTETCRGD
jgi:formylglycine-generating enzyme required for sulfatase activity